MSSSLLSIQNLSVTFVNGQQEFNALQQVSFQVNKGEVTAVVGESGSGKSVCSLSILQILPRATTRYQGNILFNVGENNVDLLTLSEMQMRNLRGYHLSMIFQEPMTSLNPLITCGRQVMEAIILHHKLTFSEARKQTVELFEKVQLPDPAGMFNRYPHQLSGGQKQRVMIAMAMSCNPVLMIADEPTTALDVTVQKEILRLLKELQLQTDLSVLFITHDLALVAEIADNTVVMYKGQIVEQGPTADLFRRPQHPYTKALLQCRPSMHQPHERLPTVADFLGNAVDSGPMPSKKQDATLIKSVSDKGLSDSNPILRVKNLVVSFGSGKKNWFKKTGPVIKAVDNVSLDIYPGETVGLVGESGCGKTTVSRAILRLEEADSGEIIFKDKSVTVLTENEMKTIRRHMQIVFQDPYSALNPRITIGDAIMEVMEVHGIGHNRQERKEKIIELLEKVELTGDHYHRYPHQFSGGQKQRIGIARTLALEPEFIIWDESVSALDVSVQAQILNLLNDLKKDFGFASLFISHDLSVVRYISDRILVMYKGQIVESGPVDQVYNNPREPYTQRLVASIPGDRLIVNY